MNVNDTEIARSVLRNAGFSESLNAQDVKKINFITLKHFWRKVLHFCR